MAVTTYVITAGGLSYVIQADDSDVPVDPPGVPGNPAATPVNATRIDFSWSASTGTVTSYTPEWSADGTTGWTSLESTSSTSVPHTGLSASTTRYYRVKATGPGGDSGYSTVKSATTYPASGGTATTFVRDTIADPDTARIDYRSGEIGSLWTRLNTAATGVTNNATFQVNGGAAKAVGFTGAVSACYYASGEPESDEGSWSADFVFPNPIGSDTYTSLVFLANTTTGSHYRITYQSYTAFRNWVLNKRVGSSDSSLSGGAYSPGTNPAGTTINAEIRWANSGGSKTFSLYLDGVFAKTWTDSSPLAGVGKVGVYANGSGTAVGLNNFRATNVGTAESYRLTPCAPPDGVPGAPSMPWTVELAPGVSAASPVTVTLHASGGAATSTPSTVQISNASPSAAFTVSPDEDTEPGTTLIISATNDGGLTDPGAAPFLVDYLPFFGQPLWEQAVGDASFSAAQIAPQYPTDPTQLIPLTTDQYVQKNGVYHLANRYAQKHGLSADFTQAADVQAFRWMTYILQSSAPNVILNYIEGFYRHWTLGAPDAFRAVALTSSAATSIANYTGTSLDSFVLNRSEYSREIAYCIKTKVEAIQAGYTNFGSAASVHRFVQTAFTMIDDYMLGPGNRSQDQNGGSGQLTSSFQPALIEEALWYYYDYFRSDTSVSAISDTRVPGQTIPQLVAAVMPKVADLVTWKMDQDRDPLEWNDPEETFAYLDDTPTIDYLSTSALNGDYLPGPIALYYKSARIDGVRDQTWRRIAYKIARGARPINTRADAGKFFSQKEKTEHLMGWVTFSDLFHQADQAWPTAPAIHVANPATMSGKANEWSLPFVVSLAEDAATAPTASTEVSAGGDPVIVTPNDDGNGGSFRPATLQLTDFRRAMPIQYRPVSGANGLDVPIGFTTDRGLAVPSAATYHVSGVTSFATGMSLTTVSGVTTGKVGVAQLLQLALNGAVPTSQDGKAGTIVVRIDVTPTVNTTPGYFLAVGGANPVATETGYVTLTLTTADPTAYLWFIPDTQKTYTLTATIVSGPAWSASVLSFNCNAASAPADALDLYAPATSRRGHMDGYVYVIPNGTFSGTSTLADSAGGTFLASNVLTHSGSAIKAAGFKAANSAGTASISVTNSGGLTNPSPRSVTVT